MGTGWGVAGMCGGFCCVCLALIVSGLAAIMSLVGLGFAIWGIIVSSKMAVLQGWPLGISIALLVINLIGGATICCGSGSKAKAVKNRGKSQASVIDIVLSSRWLLFLALAIVVTIGHSKMTGDSLQNSLAQEFNDRPQDQWFQIMQKGQCCGWNGGSDFSQNCSLLWCKDQRCIGGQCKLVPSACCKIIDNGPSSCIWNATLLNSFASKGCRSNDDIANAELVTKNIMIICWVTFGLEVVVFLTVLIGFICIMCGSVAAGAEPVNQVEL